MDFLKNYFPQWRVVKKPDPKALPSSTDRPPEDFIIAPTERPPIPTLLLLGAQHVLSMVGSTVFAPLLMGFPTTTALFFSGIATLVFFLCVGGHVPSYLGSSFAFIGPILAVTGFVFNPADPSAVNPRISEALGGIVVCGLVYFAVGVIIALSRSVEWIEFMMPPVVTGAVVMAIGLNLAPAAIGQATASGFDSWIAFGVVLMTVICASWGIGIMKRIPILIGGILGYIVYLVCGVCGVGPGINWTGVNEAAWIGAPPFHFPVFTAAAISSITPVVIVLIAENLGHVKAVSAMTGTNLDPYIGRAFIGDAVGTIISGSCGGTGTTTYAENIGVMGASKVYSTLLFVVAAFVAIFLALFPKFGAVIQSFPPGVLGGLTIVLFGLIAALGGRIWVQHGVDFIHNRNLMSAGVPVLLGAGMVNGVAIHWGPVILDGIGTSTIAAIGLWQLLRPPSEWLRLFREKGYWRREIEAAREGGVSVPREGEESGKDGARWREDLSFAKPQPQGVTTVEVQQQLAMADLARADPLSGGGLGRV
ncbi:xanthine/uracil permease family protein [Hyaloraphidium curvatum]|nr:xanthine/uracil permease family protein [Hyaloraphidium curvatum]